MRKKLFNILFAIATGLLLIFADTSMKTSSFVFHGEPDCPPELLK